MYALKCIWFDDYYVLYIFAGFPSTQQLYLYFYTLNHSEIRKIILLFNFLEDYLLEKY